jgi:hypothetical protein
MSYKVSMSYIENAFHNCHEVACKSLVESGAPLNGKSVGKYFLKNCKIKLLHEAYNSDLSPIYHFGWSHIEFENESDFIMFMLEWS